MSDRFILPGAGPLAHVRFPGIAKDTIANGLEVWTIVQPAGGSIQTPIR